MIDKNEFIQFWERIEAPKTAIPFITIYILGIALFLPLSALGNKHPVVTPIFLVLLFGYLLGMPIIWAKQLLKGREQFTKCPNCNKSLILANRNIVIQTGKCTRCGNQILKESEPIT